MKPSLLFPALLVLSSLALPLRAADIKAEFQPVVDEIQKSIQEGKRSEAELAEPLKKFEAVLAAHQGEKTDDVAQVHLLKASLYYDVLEKPEEGLALYRKVVADFPGTEAAKSAQESITINEGDLAAAKLQASLVPGAAFPDFSEKDLAGKPLSVSGLKGKVVLVDFWATWCGPCVRELPNVISAYSKYHEKGFEVVGVSLDEDKDALTKFIADKKMEWPQFFDGKGWDNKVSQQYGIRSIPATFLLDKEGKIIAKGLRGEELDAAIAKAVGGE